MPKYYCDYCDTYLTHDSPSVRKTHCSGKRHIENVKIYYKTWMEDQAQSLIDATTASFKVAGKLNGGPTVGIAIPPPVNMMPVPAGVYPPPGPPGISGIPGMAPRMMNPHPGFPPHMMGPPRPRMGPPTWTMPRPASPRPGMMPHPRTPRPPKRMMQPQP